MNNPQVFLSPQGLWNNTTQYNVSFLPSAIQVGLNLTSGPLVVDKGTTFYAIGNIQPTLGTHPANDPAWTILSPGLTINSVAPTSSNDKSQGYVVGSTWLDVTNGDFYVCTDSSRSAAVWDGLAGNV